MKRTIYLISLILAPLACFAQWSQIESFPGGKRFGAMSFTLDNEAYIVGGITQIGAGYKVYQGVWKFNPQQGDWDSLGVYPAGPVYGGISFVQGDTAYIGLGADEGGNRSADLWAFSPKTNTWTKKKQFPGETRNFAFSFVTETFAYIGGGHSGTAYLGDFWRFDPGMNTWKSMNNYGGKGRVGQMAFSLKGTGFVGGGDDGTNFYDDFYEYDEANDKWLTKASFPGSNRSFNSCEKRGQYWIYHWRRGVVLNLFE